MIALIIITGIEIPREELEGFVPARAEEAQRGYAPVCHFCRS